jgi:hypothetical protein
MTGIAWPNRALGKTWEDLEKADPDLTWQHIRSLRVSGCGFAQSGTRRSVFRAGLQQSEQLFQASNSVDYSARPLLLYYGLSQACLAILQASPRLTPEETSPKGHGMRLEISTAGIGTVVPGSDALGELNLIMKALGSGGVGINTTIERLWSTLPDHRRGFNTAADITLAPWYLNMPTNPQDDGISISVPDVGLLAPNFDATLAAMIKQRPPLADLDLIQARQGSNWFSQSGSDGFVLYTKASNIADAQRMIRMESTYYETLTPRIFASLDGSASVHPLVIWLAVLFGLSMLARYHPKKWSELLQIDGSSSAPLLEDILQHATIVCPTLILNTLDHMNVLFSEGIRPRHNSAAP